MVRFALRPLAIDLFVSSRDKFYQAFLSLIFLLLPLFLPCNTLPFLREIIPVREEGLRMRLGVELASFGAIDHMMHAE